MGGWSMSKVKNKKPDSGESGLAVVKCGLFQPRCADSAQNHRRQADPCQRARLTDVMATAEAAQRLEARFIGPMRWKLGARGASRFFRAVRPRGNSRAECIHLFRAAAGAHRRRGVSIAALQNGKAAVLRPPLPFPKSAAPRSASVSRTCVRQRLIAPCQTARA